MIKFLMAPMLFLMLVGCTATPSNAVHNTLKGDNSAPLPESGFQSLGDLTEAFARKLKKERAGQKLYFDRSKVRDVNSGDVANFSAYLTKELEASLSKDFSLQVLPEAADIFIGAEFEKYNNQVKVFLKYHSADLSVNKSYAYGIERAKLPKDSLKENLRSKATQLAADIIDDDLERKIYVQPFESSSCKCISEFSRTFANMVKNQLVRMHPQVAVVDERPVKEVMSNTRAVRGKAKMVKNLETADAAFADADSVLVGEYVENGAQVMVTLFLKDLYGHILRSSEIDIDRALITMPLQDKASVKLADLADKKNEKVQDQVKLSTSHGGDYPVFTSGEKIVFYAQVQQPLYLYIYDIDSVGNVTLLYPYSDTINHLPTYPGSLVVIPEEKDDFEFIVEPPFGKDAVKIFASKVELPVPVLCQSTAMQSYQGGVRAIGIHRKQVQGQLATQTKINPQDLIDFYRGLSARMKIPVYEDTIEVETRKWITQ